MFINEAPGHDFWKERLLLCFSKVFLASQAECYPSFFIFESRQTSPNLAITTKQSWCVNSSRGKRKMFNFDFGVRCPFKHSEQWLYDCLYINWTHLWSFLIHPLIGWRCLTLAVGVSWPSLSVAGLTHPDRTAAPASLWHGHPVAGAGMAETLAAWSTVVFPFRLCEHLLTAVTGLMGRGGSSDGRKDMITV